MAGRISEKSIAEVRDKVRIEDVIGQYVTLRRQGTSLKGLCPFHDERSPSFYVTPSRHMYKCFGCGEGGDVIDFIQKIDAVGFTEAVEHLADKVGVVLTREDGSSAPEQRGPNRGRLIEANKAAQQFYAEQLATPDALTGRTYLSERQFDRAVAEQFGIGFAPRDGEALWRHLKGRGFTQDEVVTAGLVAVGRSPYDRFRGRLVWPIRNPAGDVIGFGARRIFDDDRIEAKYLNTSETPLYKKNQVLYGIDVARKAMKDTGRAVVVEGYTDVMACHLAGVTSAVASCGTAFTPEHGKEVRRFTADFKGSQGEIVFTFDGDAAGQAAAIKVFSNDAAFESQTYVAVAPDGLDPCELRIQQGEDAVRDLVENRVPLYRFVLQQTVARFDLDRADGRVDALREGARLVSSVRDKSKVDAFARELAGLVGADMGQALAEVRRASNRKPAAQPSRPSPVGRPSVAERPSEVGRPSTVERPSVVEPGRAAPGVETPGETSGETPTRQPIPQPHPRDPRLTIERETLKLVLQHPMVIGRTTAEVGPSDFQHPAYRGVWELIAQVGGPAVADDHWATRLRDAAAASSTPELAETVTVLAVEPIPTAKEPDAGYVLEAVVRLRSASLTRQISDAHSRLQRSDPAGEAYPGLFEELARLEQQRRALRDRLVTE